MIFKWEFHQAESYSFRGLTGSAGTIREVQSLKLLGTLWLAIQGYLGYVLDIHHTRCDHLIMYDILKCPDDEKGMKDEECQELRFRRASR